MALRDDLDTWRLTPFPSKAHEIEAMRSREYRDPKNEAYRQAVYEKVSRGTSGIAPVVHDDHLRIVVGTGVIGARESEAGRSEAAQRKSAEIQWAELYGAGSVRPESREKAQKAEIAANQGTGGSPAGTVTRATARSHDID